MTPRVVRTALAVVATAALGACGEPADESGGDAGVDATSDATSDAALEVVTSDVNDGGMAADGSGDDVDAEDSGPAGACGPLGESRTYVLKTLRFARNEAGVSAGFDLDGRTSDGTDPVGCRKLDLTSPSGTPGVDNQFASLLPAIEAAGGMAFEGLIQDAINEGDILLLIELTSVESLDDDDCVSVEVQSGLGTPLLDQAGAMAANQTFARDPEGDHSHVDGARIVDGTLAVDSIRVTVPAYVFFYEFRIPVESARMEMHINEDGTATGVLGGGIEVDTLIEIVSQIDGAGGVPDAVTALAPGLADLAPNDSGQCTAVSAVLTFDAVPAYFYE
ncbi:MAG: hypothetical protein H6698_00485 [Myxococcales bacterium]|nr:hypothetical protein [Myxococcales bacterium]MCB9531560.1 hypothetical protein [Myxococcales bacterium]MCB9532789.1 hypothetical protein [Myxococcales bacterium]